MKYKLLLILFCMIAAIGVQAQELKTASVTFSQQGYTNGQAITECKVGSDITITFDKGKGSTSPTYYTADATVRLYAANTMTITAPENSILNSIKITNIKGYAAADNMCNVSPGKLTVEDTKATISSINNSEVTFTRNSESGNIRMLSITIDYTINENTVVSPTPPILPESCEFKDSKTIEITSNTEGATIYYTTDGTDPSESSIQYTGPFTITETTTVKAIAIKDGIASAFSEATYSLVVNQPTSTVSAILTSDEIKNKKNTGEGYYNGNLVGSTCGDWTGYFLSDQTNGRLQLKSDDREGYYIQSPEFSAPIKSVTLTFTASNVNGRGFVIMPSDYSGKTATVSTSGCLGSAIYDGTNSRLTVELTSEVNSFKIYAIGNEKGGTIYISQIEVVYENSASHVLSVGATGWATLYLGQDATIPDGVTCYTITLVAEGSAKLSPITSGILPAHTGVIVRAIENADYTFNYIYDYTVGPVDNLLRGSFANAHIYGGGYVLSMINDVVGLYKAKETSNLFLNNAYKAYLPASAVPVIQQSNGLRFVVEGTTDIETVQPTQSSEVIIYDLMGRRVEKMEKGIYIVNGRKVLNN